MTIHQCRIQRECLRMKYALSSRRDTDLTAMIPPSAPHLHIKLEADALIGFNKEYQSTQNHTLAHIYHEIYLPLRSEKLPDRLPILQTTSASSHLPAHLLTYPTTPHIATDTTSSPTYLHLPTAMIALYNHPHTHTFFARTHILNSEQRRTTSFPLATPRELDSKKERTVIMRPTLKVKHSAGRKVGRQVNRQRKAVGGES